MLYQLFCGILNMGITACPVIITVLFVRCLMYAFPKKYRYLIWGIVGIRLICPFAVSSPASLFNVIGTDLTNVVTMEADSSNSYYSLSGNKVQDNGIKNNKVKDNKILPGVSGKHQDSENINTDTGNNITVPDRNMQAGSVQKKQVNPVIKYGAFIWLAGIVSILSWNFYMMYCMKEHLERAVLSGDNIYECENIPSPFVTGILHPRIYIPFRLGTEEQEYILKHEKYHIKRRDYIIKPAAFLLVCIYWFNPLAWVSYFLMVRDMEMSCDEYVLQNMDVNIRKDYSMSLLGFATNQRRKTAGLLSFGETDTRKRVVNVLNFKKRGKWIIIPAVALIAAAGAACLTNAYNPDKNVVKDNENEAVVADGIINGYNVQVVYTPDEELPDKEDLEFGMYSGKFVVRTCKDNVKYAEYPLEFGINDTTYYPEEGFGLAVKDYNGDGEKDDFALGQGQMPQPLLGNFMYYQVFNVDKNGNITRYALSTENGENIVTIPDVYSKAFECKDGEITYQALTENGAETQTASVVKVIPVNNIKEGMEPITDSSFYFENIGVTIGLPENKKWIQHPEAFIDGDTGIIKYYDGIAETDVTLYFGKNIQKEELGFSGNTSKENEYWSFFPGEYEKLIEIQFYAIKNNTTTVVLCWEYNKIHFCMCADFKDPSLPGKAEDNNIEWASLAKASAYIAENWYNVLSATDKGIFSGNDIKAAKMAVKKYFKKVFSGCTIKKLWFDKEAYLRDVTYYSGLYGKDDTIILYSDFYVSKDNKDNSLDKDFTYKDFAWILSRNKNSGWKVETYGY